MSTKRIKIPALPVPQTRAQMEILAGEIVTLKLDQEQAALDMDKEIEAVRSRYAPANGDREVEIDRRMAAALEWADRNSDEFAGARSINLTSAVIGFRLGNLQLKPVKGKTWAVILEGVKKYLGTKWVRTKEEVNKELIIADRRELQDRFFRVGVLVVQDETFFVDPKVTETDTRETITKEAS